MVGQKRKLAVFALLVVILLVSGCDISSDYLQEGVETCRNNRDCGVDICSDNTIERNHCRDGFCEKETVECAEDEVCTISEVGPSTVLKCEPKTTTTTLPSIIEQIEGKLESCEDDWDCQESFCRGNSKQIYFCDNGTCNARLEPCEVGTVCESHRIWDELNGYYNHPVCVPVEKKDEIGIGLGYEIIPEPDGEGMVEITTTTIHIANPDYEYVFKHNWEMPPPIDYDYNALDAMSEDQIRALGNQINIPAFNYYENRNVHAQNYYIPFPSIQFALNPASPEGVPCTNEYYSGPTALDINLVRPPRPTIDCGWGSPASFNGVLTVSPENLLDWLYAYG